MTLVNELQPKKRFKTVMTSSFKNCFTTSVFNLCSFESDKDFSVRKYQHRYEYASHILGVHGFLCILHSSHLESICCRMNIMSHVSGTASNEHEVSSK